jgi:hypothetical protein
MSRQRYILDTIIPAPIPGAPKGLDPLVKALIIAVGIGYLALALTVLVVQ